VTCSAAESLQCRKLFDLSLLGPEGSYNRYSRASSSLCKLKLGYTSADSGKNVHSKKEPSLLAGRVITALVAEKS